MQFSSGLIQTTNKGSCFAMAPKKVMKSKGMLKRGKTFVLPEKPKGGKKKKV